MKFMVAPMKVGHDTEASLRFLKGKGARVYTLTEMDLGQTTALPLVHKVFGRLARILTKDIGAHSQEIPLIVMRALGVKVVSFNLFPLTADVGAKGAGNDRYLSRLVLRAWGRTYTFVGTHLDAVIQNHDPKSPQFGDFLDNERWTATKPAVSRIATMLAHAKATSDAVFFGGDTNTLPVGEGLTDPHSPYKMLKDLGFKVETTRVTYLAYWGTSKISVDTFPPGKGGWGSDHGALLGHFRRPPKRV